MTRIAQITSKDQVPEEAYDAFDSIVASRGNVRGPFSVLMHSPEVASRVAHLGTFIRFESSLPPQLHELAVAAAAAECECAYEWAAHAAGVKEAGISDATIEAVRSKGPIDALETEEQHIIRFVRELVRTHHVSDAAYEPLYVRLGDAGIAELTATVGYYSLLACVLNTFEVLAAAGAPSLT